MTAQQDIKRIINSTPWPEKGTVVVAVSGGPDSVCALRICDAAARVKGFTLHVAHLDHGLRGAESAEDAAFTEQLAGKLGWPFSGGYRDVAELTGYDGSLQQRCRLVRMEFLRQVVEETGASALVFGHNLDDQAETVLQHLLRGSGLQGLSGMRASEKREGLMILRPLLDLSRREIMDLLAVWRQDFREDPSNQTDKYQRNHIRHHLLPQLRETYNPQIADRLADMARTLGHDEDLLRDLTDDVLEEVMLQRNGWVSVDRSKLAAKPPALQHRALRSLYGILHGSTEDLTYYHTCSMADLLQGEHGKSLTLPNGITCENSYGELRFHRAEETDDPPGQVPAAIPVAVPGLTALPGGRLLTARLRPHDPAERISPERVLFDLARLQLPLTLRTRRPGDRFHPFGAPGSKKLKDYMIDTKMPRRLRDRQWLLTDSSGRILWIVGVRRGNYAIISSNTEQVLEFDIGDEENESGC